MTSSCLSVATARFCSVYSRAGASFLPNDRAVINDLFHVFHLFSIQILLAIFCSYVQYSKCL